MVKRTAAIRSRHRAVRAASLEPRRMFALVPLGVLSAAWTLSLVSASMSAVPLAEETPQGKAPASTPPAAAAETPARNIEEPASYSVPGAVTSNLSASRSRRLANVASTRDIPAAALSAYQRAATVMGASEASCEIPWQLLAAIARVESDHGRFGGGRLDADGVARPAIIGIPLNGRNGTRRITDSDAGQYDGDRSLDRAVGPLQFIPTTWSVVGVDADGDGVRNPQDIDDSALAAAVHLCAGEEDLGTDAGRRAAVHRYNQSWRYVDLVMSIADSYTEGSAPTVVAASARLTQPVHDEPTTVVANDPGTTTQASPGATHEPVAPKPAAPSPKTLSKTTQKPAPEPVEQPSPEPDRPAATLTTVLTEAQARARCVGSGLLALDLKALQRCIDELLSP